MYHGQSPYGKSIIIMHWDTSLYEDKGQALSIIQTVNISRNSVSFRLGGRVVTSGNLYEYEQRTFVTLSPSPSKTKTKKLKRPAYPVNCIERR